MYEASPGGCVKRSVGVYFFCGMKAKGLSHEMPGL